MKNKKYVYLFAEGSKDMRNLLGGKGANLAEMTNIGLPVPPGLTITTEACIDYFELGKKLPESLEADLWDKLETVEEATGKKFGDNSNPLLVSVRSGAVASMPGMMDTILNLGLNDETVEGLAKSVNDPRFAYDCYRRFIQMFSDVVMEVEHYEFETILAKQKDTAGVKNDNELSAEDLQNIIKEYKVLVKRSAGKEFPQNPTEQLIMAVQAVFDSWYNPRADYYRKINNISDALGTAVNVQSMVFGNMGAKSGTGVAFTRNPANGENKLYGEYLMNAQGEDVVAGIRTPNPITNLQEDSPVVYDQFVKIANLLENHYRDMQDIEFTIENEKLYMLQTRTGKRTTAAAIRIAAEMVDEKLITKEEALLRIEPTQLDQLLHRSIDPNAELIVIAKGLPASPGAGSGRIVFNADDAENLGKEGKDTILVRLETTPDDIHGVVYSRGILTSRGGMTSHAAVVARGIGKPCVCGCEALEIDVVNEKLVVGKHQFKKGDIISIDGTTGNIILGQVPMIDPELSPSFQRILTWADEIKTLSVRANADSPEEAKKAREFGAQGIGLCRTEHMFMDQARLPIVQEMILSETIEEREKSLRKLLSFQQEDFYGILKAMEGLPVTVRLLDPPLHEFLPNAESLLVDITKLKCSDGDAELLEEKEELLKKVKALSENNPMLGHRGCRLGITYPEIYRMQARAIFQATAQLEKEGYNIIPEVEVPLIIGPDELRLLKAEIDEVAVAVREETGVDFDYHVGTMIELPRACLTADEIAEYAEFFTFGTNDLTQTVLGFSRDDSEGKFMQEYLDYKIIEHNPFIVLDQKGVGKLLKYAVKNAREVKPNLPIGICGEHAGEPSSIEFSHVIGLDFVSCSPFRVPIARLAAAQAAVNNNNQSK
ncbi:pyruvate phosphate dikinase [Desulfonispora thiosulfatigenes DSM 11270]|uniref:Pyruvate, phosphate dikinase n=1 Tax=Desulfonispora thiosulfatigenes DSM 11270 TaxID=656914 RepID=A0A1W1V8Z2_DESTI|nr:pyruvate, phosphate dikinase [Desulfonispora thiosulfatigenes]SMB89755.1 pyruvate phosphate dikinase [Desulfonispora thiosulfatigenes DSM 11270]